MSAALLAGADWLPLLASLALKATVVLALAALAAALLWRASAAVRHMVWFAGVAGVLALPLLAVLLPAWELPLLPVSSPSITWEPAPASAPAPASLAATSEPSAPSPASGSPAAAPVEPRGAWLPRAAMGLVVAGVAVGLAWLALGFWGVSRLGRRAQVVRDPAWLHATHEAAEQLGLRRPVLLLRARGAVMPATGGLLWPSVVLPDSADAWPEGRRRAVLAHELAHVKRFDTLTQAVAQVACALFWWHPAVWYAARRLRVERERACDDLVLGTGTRASDYAAHLLEIARSHRGSRLAAPALVSMARPSHLESRLLWVLDAARARGAPSPRATLLTVVLALALIAPLAAMRPTEADARPSVQQAEGGKKSGSVADKLARKAGGDDGEEEKKAEDLHLRKHGAGADTIPENELEELIALRELGVDSAYVAELRAAGYGDLTGHQLIALASTGVSGRYAREMNAAGWGRLSPEQLASLSAVGVTGGYLADLRRAGIDAGSPEGVAGLRALDVDAAFAEEMRRAGFGTLNAQELSALRAAEVTPAYVRELREHGLTGLSAGEVAGLAALGVDGAFIREMRALGLQGLDAQTLSGLAAMDVDADYVRELASVGLTNLSTRQLTELRAHDVTAEYVRELRAAGFATLDANQLMRLRASGVDRELIQSRVRDRQREGRRERP